MTEAKIRTVTGFILWCLSALMSMGLYLDYAGVTWYSLLIAGLLSAALESGKILSFRRKGIRFKVLGILLSGMTLLSILGTTLSTIEATKQISAQTRLSALQINREYLDTLRQQSAVKAQADELQRRISKLPDDWVSLTLKLTVELGELNQEIRSLGNELTKTESAAANNSSSQQSSVFGAIADLLGQETAKVEVVVFMVLAFLIELTAFAMAGHQDWGGRRQSRC